MKLKTKLVLKDLAGKEIRNKEVDEKTGRLKDTDELVIGAWLAQLLVYAKTEDHYKAWLLAKKLNDSDEVDLTAEDITFIKGIIKTSTVAPLVAGQVIEILES